MKKYLYFLLLILIVSCKSNHSLIKKHVDLQIYSYKQEGRTQAFAMPKLRSDSYLNKYQLRFDYLLINVSEIHSPEKSERRTEIWKLYPDTIKLKRLYLNEYIQDEKLENYFETANAAIKNENADSKITYTINELMEVASRFFYCNKVYPDTTVEYHVCIGINGISEAKWTKDYRLLEAFCYEGIFNDLDKDNSQINESCTFNKKEACQKYKPGIITLDKYLEDVKNELFVRMKNDTVLKTKLIEYYEQNKSNLPFKIIN